MMKSWSYKAITKATEEKIIRFMAMADEAEDYQVAILYRAWAYGAYSLWLNITGGWQNDGDNERLESLTEAKPKT